MFSLEPRCHGLCGSQVFACLIRRSAKRSSGADVAMRARFKLNGGCFRFARQKKSPDEVSGLQSFSVQQENCARIAKTNFNAECLVYRRRVCPALLHKSHTSLVRLRQKGRRRSRSLAPAVGLRFNRPVSYAGDNRGVGLVGTPSSVRTVRFGNFLDQTGLRK